MNEGTRPDSSLAPKPFQTEQGHSRSASVALVAQGANTRLQYAFELAERGAVYSARAEFVKVLKLVCQALDAEHHTCTHSRALGEALRALREADDFAVDGSPLEANPDMGHVISSHQTPVLKGALGRSQLCPLLALQSYYMYAETRLTIAGANERAASMALTGLGRLQPLVSDLAVDGSALDMPKSMVFFRAALQIDPDNYVAGNELAVCLARCGRWEEARELLLHVVSVAPCAEAQANLAAACGQLEKSEQGGGVASQSGSIRAADARSNNRPTGQTDNAGAPVVRWVDPSTFARDSVPQGMNLTAMRSGQPSPARQESTEGSKGLLSRLHTCLSGRRSSDGEDPGAVCSRRADTSATYR